MESVELRPVLHAMREEKVNCETAVVRLEADLREAQARLASVQAAIAGLELLLGPSESTQAADSNSGANVTRDEGASMPASDSLVAASSNPSRRFKSADYVAQIVQEAGRPMTFAEILDEFQRSGAADGMKNPRNAIRTAVTRAAQRGLVLSLPADTYAVRPSTRGGES